MKLYISNDDIEFINNSTTSSSKDVTSDCSHEIETSIPHVDNDAICDAINVDTVIVDNSILPGRTSTDTDPSHSMKVQSMIQF